MIEQEYHTLANRQIIDDVDDDDDDDSMIQ